MVYFMAKRYPKFVKQSVRPLQNPGENDPFCEESCLRLRFYLIEYPLKDFDKKGDIRDGIQEV